MVFVLTLRVKQIKIKAMKKSSQILHYPAVFEQAKEGGFDVSFPAFPGCVTFGRTFEEAREKAREVLELWLEEITSQGQKIPRYRSHPIIDEVSVSVPKKSKVYA
jgi:predicted RNase H-like HicB family nuclease